jgi:hypothetical protein
MSRIGDYLPLRNVLSSDGICLFAGEYYLDGGYLYTYEDIENISDNDYIDKIYSNESISFLCDPEMEGTEYENPEYIVYNKNMYDLYKPDMLEGEWLSETEGSLEYISVVVGYSSVYNVGDIIQMYDTVDKLYYPFKVVGKTAPNAKFISNSSVNENANDFRDLYGEIGGNMIFVRRNDIEKTNILFLPHGINFIKYKDGLSREQITAIDSEIYRFGGILQLSEELNKNSIEYISEDIILILPICVCVLIISLICTVASSAVTVKNNMRTYLITYICGSSWHSNALISMINSSAAVLTGIVTAVCAYLCISHTSLSARFCLEFTRYEFAFCLPIVLLNIILPVILPLWIISRQTPKELLSEE